MPITAPTNISEQSSPPASALVETDGLDAYQSAVPGASPASSPRWYALRTRSRAEFRVRDGLECSGFETCLPTWTEAVRWTDREKKTIRPLFTGYVFARFLRFSEASEVLGLAGVIQILGHDELSSIPATEIENIRRIISLPAVPCPYVASGTEVVIKSGPLQGVTGRVVKQKGALRLIVSVEMLGQSCAVTIDAADVEASK